MRTLIFFFLALCSCAAEPSSGNLITNGGFEFGLAGWRPIWARQPGTGKATLDSQAPHSGQRAVRLDHTGTNDWSFDPELRLPVQAGDIFELEAWLRIEGAGSVTLCVSTWEGQGGNVSWAHGDRTLRASREWKRVRSRFAVPPGVAVIQPRLIGYQPATVWLDDYSLVRLPPIARKETVPSRLELTNAALSVTCDTSTATLSVVDRRAQRSWVQKPAHADLIVTDARAEHNRVHWRLLEVSSGLEIAALIELDPRRPEFTITLDGAGELPSALRFPHAFATAPGDWLVIPMNEGISYPVEDETIETFRLIAYGGHGICMAFWGVTDGALGHAAIIESPDDAAIQIKRVDTRLVVAPEWDSQKGQFGYARRLRYVFFDRGGHVAMAKRYREHAREAGLLKTLAEKRKENPDVDLLIGAVNVWNWDADPVATVKEMQAAGIERILWSRGGSAEAIARLNQLEALTSRYDIYQDVMDPANFPFLHGVHSDWTTAAWPKDIILRADGDWLHGWGVEGKEGKWFDCGVICDSRALDYARQRIPAELATKPYKCRFIDTTTAAPWNECYSTNHPMTRTESRVAKMQLLAFVSQDSKLVTGCETGHDASVPFLHYFEGMLSLGPYRVPDAGRDMQRIWSEVPEAIARFQLGHQYRLPLWELVYHDCVVSQWYWGDYNNKLPALWDKRDLFNLLYGTPPMFMFNQRLWQQNKGRFVQSYRNTCPFVRAAGYCEMTDHRFLTPDRSVQQTRFANGMVTTVNFGAENFILSSGPELKPMSFHVTGIPSVPSAR